MSIIKNLLYLLPPDHNDHVQHFQTSSSGNVIDVLRDNISSVSAKEESTNTGGFLQSTIITVKPYIFRLI